MLPEYVLRKIGYTSKLQLNELRTRHWNPSSTCLLFNLCLAKQTKPLYNKHNHKVFHISKQHLCPVRKTQTAFVTLVTGSPSLGTCLVPVLCVWSLSCQNHFTRKTLILIVCPGTWELGARAEPGDQRTVVRLLPHHSNISVAMPWTHKRLAARSCASMNGISSAHSQLWEVIEVT